MLQVFYYLFTMAVLNQPGPVISDLFLMTSSIKYIEYD